MYTVRTCGAEVIMVVRSWIYWTP